MAFGDFLEEVLEATSGPLDDSLRTHAREMSLFVEQHAPTGSAPVQPARRSGFGYSSPGRGVSGESVN